MLGEHLWLVLHHSQASSILVCDLLQGHEREKMPIRPHDAMESFEMPPSSVRKTCTPTELLAQPPPPLCHASSHCEEQQQR